MKRAAIALATVVCAGALAPVAEAVSVKQFAARADAICGPAGKQLNALAAPKTAKEFVAYLKASQQIATVSQHKLEQLALPSRKRSTARTAIRLSAKDVSILNDFIAALGGGANAADATKGFERKIAANARVEDKAWKALGAKVCAS